MVSTFRTVYSARLQENAGLLMMHYLDFIAIQYFLDFIAIQYFLDLGNLIMLYVSTK